VSTALHFNHPAGAAAVARLKALPSPARDRVAAIVECWLCDDADECERSSGTELAKQVRFEPTEEELALAHANIDDISAMFREAGLGKKLRGATT
jgi:hypothetical protein